MKNINQIHRLLVLISIFGCTIRATNLYIRSQSVDSARELAGWAHQVNLFDSASFYGTFAVTPEFTRTFNSYDIARSIFGATISPSGKNSECGAFNISGSCVADRNNCDLLADYFGLPTDFKSTVTLKPRIENFLVDFDLYVGLDEWLCGLWFRIHAPVVNARWKLNLNETITASGSNAYPAGYFAPAAVVRSNLLPNFTSFLAGNAPQLNGNVTFMPLMHDLVTCSSTAPVENPILGCNACNACGNSGSHNKTLLSDIQFAFGINVWQSEDYHFGLGLRAAAPTGNRYNDAHFLFYPIIGNGHHWEVGGMLTTHYTFWNCQERDLNFGIYLDANITHLFDTRQCRTFDICGAGDMSRYMLAQQLTPTISYNLQADTTCAVGGVIPAPPLNKPIGQFNTILTPVANISTGSVKVSIPVQADVTLMLNCHYNSFEWDLGYNLWAISCQKVRLCSNFNIIPFNSWALKGDASVFGFDNEPAGSPSAFLPVPLSATETLDATLFAGTNGCPSTVMGNPNIDNAQCAYGDGTSITGTGTRPLFSNTTVPANTATNPQIKTSINPVFLSDANLNIASARSKGITHKVFTHISYSWQGWREWYIPYIGIGGKAEFAAGDTKTAHCFNQRFCTGQTSNSTCNSSSAQCVCHNSALSQWGIWLKGGVSF